MDAHSGRDLGARAQSDRSPTAAPKWQPARDFGDRHIMRMQLPIISRASPMLLLCSVKLDQSRFDQVGLAFTVTVVPFVKAFRFL